jgi:outer membrane protein OmpA-like peptidoglycan-associated protein
MIPIRRFGCAAAAIGLVVGVSVVLILPQRVLAQAEAAGDAAGPQSDPATVSGSAIHVEMAQTARSRRKPLDSSPPVTTPFKPPGVKPLSKAQAEDAAAQEPAAAQATEPSRLPETMPAPSVAEAASPQERVAARLPNQTAGGATTGNVTEGKATEGVVREDEANRGNQQAARPPASAPALPPPIAQLVFAPEAATLSAEAKGMLKDLAARFPRHDENARLQLIAYASGEGMSASKARRLSLARALSVREYLIANGIEGTRMDVRALGEEAGGLPSGSPADSPANRVDIAMIKR